MPATAPEEILAPGAVIAEQYQIIKILGHGAMGSVFLATDLTLDRYVALKVLKPEPAAVVGAERFLAEIKTTANLTHPHILPQQCQPARVASGGGGRAG